jgi:hypothetical protein
VADTERTAGGPAADPEREARILAERARLLAAPPPAAGEESVAVIAFEAGEERFGVTLEAVLRVERVGAVARVPGAPQEALGVIAVDGRPCPLLDAAALLGAAPRGQASRWAVVLGRRGPEVALAADAIDLASVPRALVERGGLSPGVTPDARRIVASEALLRLGAGKGGAP